MADDYRIAASSAIWRKLKNLPEFIQAKNVLLYHSLPDEVATVSELPIIAEQKQVFLPVVEGENLRIEKYNTNVELHQGAFSIMEPTVTNETITLADIDLVVVPAVGISRTGKRIGRGKGYYDRLLATRPDVLKVGIIFAPQLTPDFPCEAHDMPMDIIVTENELIRIIH